MQTAVWVSLLIVLVLVVLLALFLWSSYRALVGLRDRVDEAWRDILAQLQGRAELVPEVVSAVRGYASHEQAVFDSVTTAREETLHATAPGEATVAETHMQQALRSVMATADAFPPLSASPDFLRLQGELADADERIQASRRFYNGGVRELNTKAGVFPNVLFAKRLGVQHRDFFEAAEGKAVAQPPRVQF